MLEAHFKIIALSGVIDNIDILDPTITGFPKNEVSGVKVSPYFPGYKYLEKGVVWHWNHAICGSMTFL